MSDESAPLITKYQETKAPEGYNFILIQNQDEEQKYKETVKYANVEGLTMLHDPGAEEYSLSVGPGETKIVIMEASLQGFSYSSSMSHEIFLGDTALK